MLLETLPIRCYVKLIMKVRDGTYMVLVYWDSDGRIETAQKTALYAIVDTSLIHTTKWTGSGQDYT
jgi:hypothetical protein